jgi:hypothetical protein
MAALYTDRIIDIYSWASEQGVRVINYLLFVIRN